jgi:hypothetical protein
MKRLFVILALLVAVLATASTAIGVPGVDPPSVPEDFDLVFEEVTQPRTFYDILPFERADGWDFGDREGYQCAFIERFDASGNLLFKLEFEISEFYTSAPSGETFRINDRGGAETGEGGFPPAPGDICGAPAGEGAWVPSGEDHFPHMSEGASPETHGVRLYVDGFVDPVATDTLNAGLTNADCDRGYWTPGDEERELVLWWDLDFPENGHEDGSHPLDCGGGGDAPFAVARLYFAELADNAGVCILDHDVPGGRVCTGMVEPPPSPTPSPSPPVDCNTKPRPPECPKPPKN